MKDIFAFIGALVCFGACFVGVVAFTEYLDSKVETSEYNVVSQLKKDYPELSEKIKEAKADGWISVYEKDILVRASRKIAMQKEKDSL